MTIPEAQLETWSHQGSITQSAQTYETIRTVLNDSSSPYFQKDFEIFLQGSYGNNTNVYRDSDVDIVIRLNQTFYSDLDNLEPGAKAKWNSEYKDVQYGYNEFKAEVLTWLTRKFGAAVEPGKKAIFVRGNNGRRDADVLVCVKLRRYRKESTGTDGLFDEGVCFFLPDRARIVNFPEQHRANCIAKHQYSNNCFKPVVRMYKNMRNRMVDSGDLGDGIAPSYFIEGLLWNVPNANFGKRFDSSFVNTLGWIQRADEAQLACASDLHWLVREGTPYCWPAANLRAYLAAMVTFWKNGGN